MSCNTDAGVSDGVRATVQVSSYAAFSKGRPD